MKMTQEQLVQHFSEKLAFETDSWDLAQALKAEDDIVVIDARSSGAYDKEHIPRAINLPHKEMNEESTKDFDKNILYITYCDGIGCNASTKGALNMSKLGFQVKELLGGLDWWKRDGHPTVLNGAYSGEELIPLECGC